MTHQVFVGKPEWVAQWLRHERALSHRLAEQISALTTLLNGHQAPAGPMIRNEHSRKLLDPPAPTCRWRDDEGLWEGDCGITWEIPNEAGPAGNQMLYCPTCGRVLEVMANPEETEDD